MRLSCPECGSAARMVESNRNTDENEIYIKYVCTKCSHEFFSIEYIVDNDDTFKQQWERCRSVIKTGYQSTSIARVTWDGETHTYSEWAEITGIPSITIRRRIDRGWAPELALTVPVNKRGKRSDTVKDWYKFCMKRGIK